MGGIVPFHGSLCRLELCRLELLKGIPRATGRRRKRSRTTKGMRTSSAALLQRTKSRAYVD